MSRRATQAPVLAAAGLLALCAGLLRAGAPARHPAAATVPTPARLGLWAGTPLPLTEDSFELLGTEDVTLMEYRLGSEPPLWLAQIGGVGTRAAFHPPEICYLGSHFEVLEREPITVALHGQPRRLMRLVVAQGRDRFEAWYWFTANGRITPNYYRQQAWLLSDAIARKPMAGSLIRISTPLEDPKAARRRLFAFLDAYEGVHSPASHAL
jgi:EpsI family protein